MHWIFFLKSWHRVAERGIKGKRQRADSCMDEKRVISLCCPATILNASFVDFVANGLSLESVALKGRFFFSADGALAFELMLDPHLKADSYLMDARIPIRIGYQHKALCCHCT